MAIHFKLPSPESPMAMTTKNLLRLIVYGAPILTIGGCLGCLSFDAILLSRARPPRGITTLADFNSWKGEAILGHGTFEHGGTNYTVMLGPAGRTLASGPSAYVFDSDGQFVDWTSDMGDFRTRARKFDLGGGALKNVQRKIRQTP
jgi:hypothetical protein